MKLYIFSNRRMLNIIYLFLGCELCVRVVGCELFWSRLAGNSGEYYVLKSIYCQKLSSVQIFLKLCTAFLHKLATGRKLATIIIF